MPTTIKRLQKPKLVAGLKLVLKPEPHGHWEGELKGRHGSAKKASLFVKADIRFLAGVIEGHGRAPEFPVSAPGAMFALDGSMSSRHAEFALSFDAETLRRSPFACSGNLDARRKNLRGEWSFACFHPETCGCNGGGGDFHLWRVD